MFAQRLKKLREEKDIRQKELAQFLNVMDATVSMWEAGKRIPDSETLKKIANYFDVSVDYLLGNAKDKEIKENVKEVYSDEEGYAIDIKLPEGTDDIPHEVLQKMMDELYEIKRQRKEHQDK